LTVPLSILGAVLPVAVVVPVTAAAAPLLIVVVSKVEKKEKNIFKFSF
jgi:hypothetical protein